MTSVIVPPVDLAPGMPSRVVTISATDVTEGGKSLEGQMVRFALSDSLDVTSGGDVIAKTQAEVVLDSQGNGSIRLPVYTDAVKTWCGDPDWVILVTATWGSQKAIRVPAGTTSIALSALPPVRPLRGREKQWAITGVSVTVTEGAQWGATVGLSGGILDFDFTVPPGATAFPRGNPGAVSFDTLTDTGIYWWAYASDLGANAPTDKTGFLTVINVGGGITYHQYTDPVNGRTWTRRRWVGTWGAWREVGDDGGLVSSLGVDSLDGYRTRTAAHIQVYDENATPARGYPPIEGQYKAGTLDVVVTSGGVASQTYTVARTGEIWTRLWYINVWRDWVRASGGGGGSSGGGTGALARLAYEETGEYTPPSQADAFLEALADHRSVSRFVIGQTVQGADIPAISIGDPSKPALYVGVGVHGSEVGCRDGALLWARDLLSDDTYMQLDMCIVVVPNINIDRWNNTYVNANNVNINSDFIDKTQPEVQAVSALMDGGQFDFVAGVDVHNFGYARQTSIRYPEEEGAAHVDVQARGADLFAAVTAAHEAAGYSIRRYGDPGNPGSQWRALGQQWALPSLLLEIPSFQPANKPSYTFNPRRAESARVSNALSAVATHVWENLPAFVAARDAGLADPVPVTPIPPAVSGDD